MNIVEKIKLVFHSILKTKKISRAYHEAGHGIVAELFNDLIELKLLTINEKAAKKYDDKSNGGLSMKLKYNPKNDDYENGDKISLVALAGICSRTLYLKGRNYVIENRFKFPNNPNLVDFDGSSEDLKIAEYNNKRTSLSLKIKTSYIMWSAMIVLFDFFFNPEIYTQIKLLAEKLLLTKGQTLEQKELEIFMQQSGIREKLKKYKKEFYETRYPLTKTLIINSLNKEI